MDLECDKPGPSGLPGSSSEPVVEGEDTSCTGPSSLLGKLQAPKSSDIARKRKLKTNPAIPSKHGCRYPAKTIHNPKSVTPSQRVSQYPEEPLTVTSGKLSTSIGTASSECPVAFPTCAASARSSSSASATRERKWTPSN